MNERKKEKGKKTCGGGKNGIFEKEREEGESTKKRDPFFSEEKENEK